jgi:hypothetical protein
VNREELRKRLASIPRTAMLETLIRDASRYAVMRGDLGGAHVEDVVDAYRERMRGGVWPREFVAVELDADNAPRIGDASTRPLDYAVTFPAMLDGAPLVAVSYNERKRYGYIEIPTVPTVQVLTGILGVATDGKVGARAKVPVGRDQLAAMVNVLQGWPLR